MDWNKLLVERILYPYLEKTQGNQVRKKLKELKESEKLSVAELRALQAEKLRALLLHSIKEVPAYEDAGVSAEEIQADPFAALAKFPLLYKDTLRTDMKRYISKDADESELVGNITSGRTGEPLKFLMDKSAVEYYKAATFRALSWYKITPGGRSLMIWGHPDEDPEDQDIHWSNKQRIFENRCVLPAYQLNAQYVQQYVKFLYQFRPAYVYGYGSALSRLAGYLRANEYSIKKVSRTGIIVKAVMVTADDLSERQEKTIRQAFPLSAYINEYSATDAGTIAYSCPKGHLHLNAENLIMEILDPFTLKPVAAGETGLIVVTDLNNMAAPRLRYVLEDMGCYSTEPCECGRALPVIEFSGRESDMFQLPGGKLIHGRVVAEIAEKFDTIDEVQMVQDAPDHAFVRIVQVSENCPAETIFLSRLKDVFPGIRLEAEYWDGLPLTDYGKVRSTIREFPLATD